MQEWGSDGARAVLVRLGVEDEVGCWKTDFGRRQHSICCYSNRTILK